MRGIRLALVAAVAVGLFVVALTYLGETRNGSISGTVVDAAGLPVADVIVIASRDGDEMGRATTLGTGSVGFFALDDLPTPDTYTVEFSRAGFLNETRRVTLAQASDVTDVNPKLNPVTSTISGTVADAAGLPLADVNVVASRAGAEVDRTTSLRTGSVGFFSLDGLATPGTYAVEFSKAGLLSETRSVTLGQAGNVTGLNPRLNPVASTISGTVADANGVPLADVTVIAARDGVEAGRTTSLTSGSVGFFAFAGLPTPGTYAVEFSKAGFLSETRSVTLGPSGNVTDLNPRLNPVTSAISGLVTEDARKVPGCGPRECALGVVQVTITDSLGAQVRSTSTSSFPPQQEGRYSMAGIPAGEYTATFTKPGYVTETIRFVLGADQQRALDARLRAELGSVAGNAENCAEVELLFRDGTQFEPPSITRVRGDGGYQFARVETRGEYVILFRGPTGSVEGFYDIDVRAGEKLTGIDGACTFTGPR